VCTECAVGMFSFSTEGSPFCLKCPAGFHMNETNARTCVSCATTHMFADESKQVDCKSCETDKTGLVPNNKSTACEKPPYTTIADCKGFKTGTPEYLNNAGEDKTSWTCKRCPSGADCNTKQTLATLKPNPKEWWKVPWAEPSNPTFAKCPYLGRCFVHGCKNNTGGPVW
jgi:hypothetical protein